MPAALEPFFALFPIHPQDRDHEGDPPTENNRAGSYRDHDPPPGYADHAPIP